MNSTVRDERQPPRLFVRPPTQDLPRGFLSWLSELYGLRVFGNSKLSLRASIEMGYAALLLTIIFFFDLLAWSLLWNMILHGGEMVLGWQTILAVFFALLFSLAIFIYERGFVTTDFSKWKFFSKASFAVGIRLVVLLIAAFVTSQPLEVIVFKGPIGRRIHEESVLAKAIQLLPKPIVHSDEEIVANNKINKKKDDADDKYYRATGTVNSLNKDIANKKNFIENRKRELAMSTSTQRPYVQLRIDDAEREEKKLESRLKLAKENAASAQAEVKGYENDKSIIDYQQNGKNYKERENRLAEFVQKFVTANSGEIVPSEFGEYKDKATDFFQRLRILEDLKNGYPKQWPDEKVSTEDMKIMREKWHVVGAAEDDPKIIAQRVSNASIFQWHYWFVFGITFVIPLMIFAFKLLLPHELNDYYSSESQAHAGDYYASLSSVKE